MSDFIGSIIAYSIIIFLIICSIIIMTLTVAIPMWGISQLISPTVEVFVDQKLIYTGIDFCVDVSSGGCTTTVKTKKFFCVLPDKSYTSKDVAVRTVEGNENEENEDGK